MNKFDEQYDIRLATADEADEIMNFLDEHWKKGHILSINKELFNYEFLDKDKVTLHIIIAKNRTSHKICGLCGFLPCSDTADISKKDIWGSIWKVVEGEGIPAFLGIELIKRLKLIYPHRYNIGIGINKNTTAIIRKVAFKEHIALMKHYYMLNNSVLKKGADNFKIAKIHYNPIKTQTNIRIYPVVIKRIYNIEEINSTFIPDITAVPYKDLWYINKRFLQHPLREYMVYSLSLEENNTEAIIVLREERTACSKALRIVDYIGAQSLFTNLGNFFENLIENEHYEYADLYTYGFDEQYILSAGFSERKEDDTNIIPNYFSPFVAENIDIYVRSPYENTVFMKADGDQDRPN